MSTFDSSRHLSGPEPFVLRGENALWSLEAGSLAVFTAELCDGRPVGRRRFLTRMGKGSALLSLGSVGNGERALFALPVGSAELSRLPLDGPPSRRLEDGIEAWITQVGEWSRAPQAPALALRAQAAGTRTLEDGQQLASSRNTVLWLRVLSGRVELGGNAQHLLEPCDGPHPLGPEGWVRACGETTVELLTSAELEDAQQRLRGLVRQRRQLLAALEDQVQAEAREERERIENRAQRQAQRARSGLAHLGRVLGSSAPSRKGGTPLLEAARMVARANGIEPRPRPAGPAGHAQPDDIEDIARAFGVRLRHVGLRGTWWRRDGGALIGFMRVEEERRPVALLRDARGYVAHPGGSASPQRVDARLASSIEQRAHAFQRPLPPGPRSSLDLVRFALRGRRPDVLRLFALGLLATALGMLLPLGTAALFDQAVPDADRRFLLEIVLGLGAAVLGRSLFLLAQRVALLRIGLFSEAETQGALWDRLLTLPPSFFRRHTSGDLEARVSSVSEAGRELSGRALGSLFAGVLALANFALLLHFSLRLSLLALVLAALVAALTLGLGRRVRRELRSLFEVDGRHFGLEVQLVQAVAKLRVAGAESRAFTHWLTLFTERTRLSARALVGADLARVAGAITPTLSTALLFAVALGELRGSGSGLALGEFLAFQVAFAAFLGGVTTISETLVEVQDSAAKARRAEPILRATPEVEERRADPGPLSGNLSLEGVRFRYGETGPDVLHSIDLHAEPGEFIALVGPSGSGKSTILRLLLGFETAREGSVRYDGRDLETLDLLALRRQLGVVLQGGRLSVGSVLENIAGGASITLDEAWAAAEDAGLGDDVRGFPMGMHTVVSEGGENLSGGQRQRLLIARALARRPRLLLFDEATSALDNRTQAVISASLARLRVTRIVVAHRLSTVRDADRIYVIDAGRVVEAGSFSELMAGAGLFARMMSRQVGAQTV